MHTYKQRCRPSCACKKRCTSHAVNKCCLPADRAQHIASRMPSRYPLPFSALFILSEQQFIKAVPPHYSYYRTGHKVGRIFKKVGILDNIRAEYPRNYYNQNTVLCTTLKYYGSPTTIYLMIFKGAKSIFFLNWCASFFKRPTLWPVRYGISQLTAEWCKMILCLLWWQLLIMLWCEKALHWHGIPLVVPGNLSLACYWPLNPAQFLLNWVRFCAISLLEGY